MFESLNSGKPEIKGTVVFVLVLWCILLVLGALPALMGTGMAFEGGHTLDAYLFLIATWSYPPLVAIAFFYRRRKPVLVWLPVLTVFLFIAELLLSQLGVRVKFSD